MPKVQSNFPSVLIISPLEEDWRESRRLLGKTSYRLRYARDAGGACRETGRTDVAAIIIEADEQPDAWRTVLDDVRAVDRNPGVIVVSRRADDDLWLRVLDAGAFELLPKPLREQELRRAVDGAVADWRHLR